MRVNVYGSEIVDHVEIVTNGRHRGVRFSLESADVLMMDPKQDHRSAVTFWDLDACLRVFRHAVRKLEADRDATLLHKKGCFPRRKK